MKTSIDFSALILSLVLFSGCQAAPPAPTTPSLKVLAEYHTGFDSGAEIVSVQAQSALAAVTLASGQIDLIDLNEPDAPRQVARISLNKMATEEVTSVAIHPTQPIAAVAIRAESASQQGTVALLDLTRHREIQRFTVGYWPDAVAFSKDGRHLAVANEGEGFTGERHGELQAYPGSISLISQVNGEWQVHAIVLPDLTGMPGLATSSDRRYSQTTLDLNNNGLIDATVDLDGDGVIGAPPITVARFRGEPVFAQEEDGEEINVPLFSHDPLLLQPEYVAFTPDGKTLLVSLQENNAIAVIDVAKGQFIRAIALGVSQHSADLRKDKVIDFSDTLRAFREPDGICVTPDGRYLITADEGDTRPKASVRQPAGGSRTVSVVDIEQGVVIGDTGGQLDQWAHRIERYDDKRSEKRGSEPEMVACLTLNSIQYAAVGLERGNSIALVDLSHPQSPQVVAIQELGAGQFAPEGLAYFQHPKTGQSLLLTGNEKAGSVSVVEVQPASHSLPD